MRRIYIVGLFLWLTGCLLFPVWEGRVYYPDDPSNPTAWFRGGFFGLRGASRLGQIAPIWDPPSGHAVLAAVRWPWQPIQGNHVEISWMTMTARWSCGVILFGMLLRVHSWIRPSHNPDAVLSVAWSLSIALIIAWVWLLGLGFMSMGMILEIRSFFYGSLVAGVVAGVTIGLRKYRASVARQKVACFHPNDMSGTDPRPGIGSRFKTENLLWYLLGTIVGFGELLIAVFIATFFRGNRIGVNEMGGDRFDRDQFPIDLATGMAIVATAWLVGVLMIKLGLPRALGVGLIVTATVLGVLVPF